MKILVYKKNIERSFNKSNNGYHHKITSASKELLFKFESSILPSHGEILYKEDKKYFVNRVIRVLPTTEFETEYFILEVEDYKSEYVFYDNVETTTPLVVDID